MKKFFSMLLMFATLCIPFTALKAQAAQIKQVQAFHILVKTQQEAADIRAKIMEGKTRAEIFDNFTKSAKIYSECPSGADGGKLGWFSKGDMVKPFEEAAFNLEEGTVSEPVKTQFGWHLIYVVSKK